MKAISITVINLKIHLSRQARRKDR